MAYTTIKKPSDYFNTVQWTGNNTSTRSITGVGFQPDLTWKKERNAAFSIGHMLYDSVRGLGVNKHLDSSTANAEGSGNDEVFGYFTSFDADGFSVSNGSSGNDYVNNPSYNYVAWNWLGSNTTASNTDGSITSTVSANTTSGFSIVSYTGTGANATVGHSLGSVPKMIILKERNPSTTRSWRVYHEDVGNDKVLYLDMTNAQTTDTTAFNSTTPTSSVFSLGTSLGTNSSGKNYIAYCFADVKGFSKFGSYNGNGNADGTFVYTGFKPAFIIVKKSDSTSNWGMWDTKRNTFNVSNSIQRADTNDAQVTLSPNNDIDILSNGFKVRSTTGLLNASGGSYIYMAFAAEPLVGDNPCTAR